MIAACESHIYYSWIMRVASYLKAVFSHCVDSRAFWARMADRSRSPRRAVQSTASRQDMAKGISDASPSTLEQPQIRHHLQVPSHLPSLWDPIYAMFAKRAQCGWPTAAGTPCKLSRPCPFHAEKAGTGCAGIPEKRSASPRHIWDLRRNAQEW